MKNKDEYTKGYDDAIKDFNSRIMKFSINSYYPMDMQEPYIYKPPMEAIKERMVRQLVDKILETKSIDFELKRDFLELQISIIKN